jgi:hypothetical protein
MALIPSGKAAFDAAARQRMSEKLQRRVARILLQAAPQGNARPCISSCAVATRLRSTSRRRAVAWEACQGGGQPRAMRASAPQDAGVKEGDWRCAAGPSLSRPPFGLHAKGFQFSSLSLGGHTFHSGRGSQFRRLELAFNILTTQVHAFGAGANPGRRATGDTGRRYRNTRRVRAAYRRTGRSSHARTIDRIAQ